MGTITENFANLSELLLAESKSVPGSRRPAFADVLANRWLRSFLPGGLRCGRGAILDIKDRQVGPFDLIGCSERFPGFGEGAATSYVADGVVFCINARDWVSSDLSHFGELATQVNKLERKPKKPIACFAVSYTPLVLEEVTQFLKGKAGESVSGVLTLGHHIVIRNTAGWYGDPKRIPFVTERAGPEALKALTFLLIELSQTALGMPFGLANYQHL